jgi:hypothetical protein
LLKSSLFVFQPFAGYPAWFIPFFLPLAGFGFQNSTLVMIFALSKD